MYQKRITTLVLTLGISLYGVDHSSLVRNRDSRMLSVNFCYTFGQHSHNLCLTAILSALLSLLEQMFSFSIKQRFVNRPLRVEFPHHTHKSPTLPQNKKHIMDASSSDKAAILDPDTFPNAKKFIARCQDFFAEVQDL
jgi:hypothetical protein